MLPTMLDYEEVVSDSNPGRGLPDNREQLLEDLEKSVEKFTYLVGLAIRDQTEFTAEDYSHELGKILFNLTALAHEHNLSLRQVMEQNKQKLITKLSKGDSNDKFARC